MKVQLESTTKVVWLHENGERMEARVWEGESESGIPIQAFIVRVSTPEDADASQFEAELKECRKPSPDVAALPLSLIL